MNSKDIRAQFIQFFEKYGHKFVPSSPVVPYEDPTLLFSNAGMNQFKNIFLGMEKRDYTRAVNTQKCIRVSGKHNDLEEVGKDTYHHTFFEMLGNWSFGDYYKLEAIRWAWELLTIVWKLPKDKLYATVFRDDDEAEELWKKETDIFHDHVLRFGEKDNFWEMGDVGPCGPCSEIHIDLGDAACDKKHVEGHKCQVNGDCARFIELWNLVFIQYNRENDGRLKELPSKHVDTGMGFERIVSVLQGVGSNYDTDLFTPILQEISKLTGKPYNRGIDGMPHRVIADHVRALSFAIADGALPSNEGRGYVLRRILRRASRYARKLDVHEPIIYKLVPVVVEKMGEAFPEIKEKSQYVAKVIKAEEESFNNTLDRGIELFEKLVKDLKQRNINQISGFDAFRLYDTYGFPLDLTQLMAEEKNMSVDESTFHEEMEKQRDRARKAGKWEYGVDIDFEDWTTVSTGPDSQFVGYDSLETDAVVRLYKKEEDLVYIIFDNTPFYAESGGQIGDKGEIVGSNFLLSVENTVKMLDKIVHVAKGDLPEELTGAIVQLRVKKDSRNSTARNHTATHLLHAALRKVLGDHVNQSGSLVTPYRLRFDFTHFERVTTKQLQQVEQIVNEKIWDNFTVQTSVTSFDEAKKLGAMALFGEKYGDTVRVIKVNDFSMELCGGTHVVGTGQIGVFRIVSESSVAAGIRRIEAVTGEEAYRQIIEERNIIQSLTEVLHVNPEGISAKIEDLIQVNKKLEKDLQQLRLKDSYSVIDQWLENSIGVVNFRLVINKIDVENIDEFKQIGDALREKLKSGIGVLGTVMDDKVNFLCVITDDLIKNKKLKAGDIVKEVAAIAGGGGGGRPHMALAGAKEVDKVDVALKEAENIIRLKLK